MRRIQQITLLFIITAMIISSCKAEILDSEQVKFSAMELNSEELLSKSPVTPDDAFSAQILGSSTSNDYTTIYSDRRGTAADMSADFSTASGASATRTVTLSSILYYPTSGATLYLKAFSPKAETGKAERAANNVNFTIDGSQDIMMSDEVNGTKLTITPLLLTLTHKLTQVNIKVKAGNDGASAVWGNITKIEILSRPSNLDLNLQDGTIAAGATPAPISIVIYNNATGQGLTTEYVTIGSPVMFLPVTDSWVIRFTTQYETAEVTSDLDLKAGESNLISVTFKARIIELSATVTDWVTGGNEEHEVI